MACSVTIDDGVNSPVVLENWPENSVAFGLVSGGGTIHRFRDGSAVKQTKFQKKTISLTGQKTPLPTGLRDLDYSQELTVTIVTGLGSEVFTCVSEIGPRETWGLGTANVDWSLDMEEV